MEYIQNNRIKGAAGLEGLYTAIITPMRQNSQIDYDKLGILVENQIESGVDGIVACGSTGQGYLLRKDERESLVERINRQINGRTKLIVGVGGFSTDEVVDNMNGIIDRIGSSTFLIAPPSNIKATQEGLLNHYGDICVNFPESNVILYNVPARNAVDLKSEFVVELAGRFENIIGLKQASSDLVDTKRIIDSVDSDKFRVICGEDCLITSQMMIGAYGVISACSNAIPDLSYELVKANFEKNVDRKNKLQKKMNKFARVLMNESLPNPTGLALFHDTYLRSPLQRDDRMLPLIKQTYDSLNMPNFFLHPDSARCEYDRNCLP